VLLPWTSNRSTFELARRQLLGRSRSRQVLAGGDRDPKDADDVPLHTDRSHDDLELGELTACCLIEAGSPPGSAAERHCCLYTNVPGDSRLAQEDGVTALGSPVSLEELRRPSRPHLTITVSAGGRLSSCLQKRGCSFESCRAYRAKPNTGAVRPGRAKKRAQCARESDRSTSRRLRACRYERDAFFVGVERTPAGRALEATYELRMA
jgi:hypothetical protein